VTQRQIACASLLLAALAAGCGRQPIKTDGGAGTGGDTGQAGAGGQSGAGGTIGLARKVDMLFVIKNSGSPVLIQNNLLRNFPVFLTRLSDPPGLPDLHIAVISDDMGAGDGSIASCNATGGKNGVFQFSPRGSCTSTGLDPGATYIADAGVTRNYTGNLADVFTCIAALGSTGCAFEHDLAAITRALGADGQPAPAENQGFLRPDAFLFIMILTDEDDCSAPPGSTLFDTRSTNLASPLGPLTSYRCNEFGHLCGGMKPPRLAPSGSPSDLVLLQNCVSAEAAGMLTPVATVVAQLRALKAYPDAQIVVTAIAGPTAPYQVGWRNYPGVTDTGPWPVSQLSCTGTDGTLANPGVRIAQFAESFRQNGMVQSACDTNYGPSLDRIAQLLSVKLPR
jgi:hypothetical protein